MHTSRDVALPQTHDWHRLPGLMMALSREARLLAVNESLAACTGWHRDAAADGEAWLDRLSAPSRRELLKALDNVGTTDRFRLELQFRRPGGEVGWLECDARWNRDTELCLCALHDVSARKRTELALREQTTQLRVLADNVPALIAYYEQQGFRCTFANRHYASALGWTPENILGRTAAEIVGERGWQQIRPYIEQVVETRAQVSYERELTDTAGRPQWLEVDVLPNFDDEGELSGAFVRVTDITKHRLAERAVRESEDRLAKFMQASAEGILFHRNGTVIDINAPICELTGYARDEVIGRQTSEFLAPDHLPRAQQALATGAETAWESVALGRSGERIPVELITRSIMRSGERLRLVIVRDIRERVAAQARIHHLAHHDALTGLPNRAAFGLQLEQLTASHRAGDAQIALLFIDLDHFKRINDSLGHLVGDLLLQTVTARITASLRADDVVARFGGDEFMVLIPGVTDRSVVEQVAGKLLAVIEAPLEAAGRSISVSPSIGVSLFPEHGRTPAELIQHADAAMYMAKARGRANVQFFDPVVASAAYDALVVESQLAQALETGAFELHYQPQLRSSDGRLVGVEALIRWHHPERGLLLPDDFIPVAEERRLMLPIGQWVLREAMRCARRWHAQGLELPIGQPQQHAVPAARLRRLAGRTAAAGTGERRVAGARTDRAHADGRPGRGEGLAGAAQGPGHAHLGRRLRHRLLVARPPEGVADRQGEDRSVLRAGRAAERRRRSHRAGDRAARPQPGHDRHRRGRGDRGPGALPARTGMRRTAGPADRAAALGGRPADLGRGPPVSAGRTRTSPGRRRRPSAGSGR